MSNYVTLIRYLLDNTDMKVYLIPHVVWKDNDDRIPLTLLKKAFDSDERVILSNDAPAAELKGLISSLRFFVGARTHSTIAAYSSCVPTLVAGYSVKARGIARDLMGTEEGFVVPVQQMHENGELCSAFKNIMDRESEIKKQLENIIPSYIDNAKRAADLIKDLLS
jgi:polysaccharide pyruvyl transferase WcaK-like protein